MEYKGQLKGFPKEVVDWMLDQQELQGNKMDITKCPGSFCPMKEMCVRYTATPNDYQSWFDASPIEGEDCDYFWDNDSQKKGLNGPS